MPESRPSPALRKAAVERAREQCEYCRCFLAFAPATFEVDHVLPLARGGGTDLTNLALACGGCNGAKHMHTEGVDPVDGTRVPLFNPRLDLWPEHFSWSHDATIIIGITARGRATIERLRMNRQELINLRSLLGAVGLHPPAD